MFLSEVIEHAKANNGGSYRMSEDGWVADMPGHGYMVSRPLGVENSPILSEELVEAFVLAHQDSIELGTYLGMWNASFKGEPELWSIDESEWVETRDEAIKVGLMNNQRAIYDIANDFAIGL